MALSGQVVENLDLVQIARAPMEALSRQVHETVHLVVPEGTDIVYVHKVDVEQGAIRMFLSASACAARCTARAWARP